MNPFERQHVKRHFYLRDISREESLNLPPERLQTAIPSLPFTLIIIGFPFITNLGFPLTLSHVGVYISLTSYHFLKKIYFLVLVEHLNKWG